MKWLLTCEHYSNHIPMEYLPMFKKAAEVVDSPRGYDPGVASLFHHLAPLFDQHFHYPYSRLLIEPNRSLHHRHLFSAFSMHLSKEQRMELIARYYQPYRKTVEKFVGKQQHHPVVHVSAHTFAPKSGNQMRQCEVGILFDPKQDHEKAIARLWKKEIQSIAPVKVRFNYPYRGTAYGITTYLRRCFPFHYSGLELEVRNDVVDDLHAPIHQSVIQLKDLLQLSP